MIGWMVDHIEIVNAVAVGLALGILTAVGFGLYEGLNR